MHFRTNKSERRTVSVLPALLGLPLFLVFTCVSIGYSQGVGSASAASGGPAFKAQGQLVFLKHGSGAVLKMITIQIADNDAERAEGLMWRRYMPENEGMLFIFGDQELLTFWMKNTYIPLDMVFANKEGKIVRIYPDATPLSEASISSNSPAQYVVEVNAGFCAKYGINVGDKIEFER